MPKAKEVYISVDVETAGPNPDNYSLLSIGACQVYNPQDYFYVELKPTSKLVKPDALAISGLDWDQLNINGIPPKDAMGQFADWVNQNKTGDNQPIFVALNAPFDWMFVNDYFHRYLSYNPFGHKALDIKALFMGLHHVPFSETSNHNICQHYGLKTTLSHHAMEDAVQEAQLLSMILEEL